MTSVGRILLFFCIASTNSIQEPIFHLVKNNCIAPIHIFLPFRFFFWGTKRATDRQWPPPRRIVERSRGSRSSPVPKVDAGRQPRIGRLCRHATTTLIARHRRRRDGGGDAFNWTHNRFSKNMDNHRRGNYADADCFLR